MKALICCLVSCCIIINAGIAQHLSFLNLTTNKITSDTVFTGITNEFISKQSLAGIKFHSTNASIGVDQGILKVIPHVRGKVIIGYKSDLVEGELILNATVLPAPTPVLKMEPSPATNSASQPAEKFKVELVIPGCSERFNQYEVVSFKAKVDGELIKIEGNRLPREILYAASQQAPENVIIIESIEARPGTSFNSFTLNRQYRLAIQ